MKNVDNAVKNFRKEFNVRNTPDIGLLKSIIKAMNYKLLTYKGNEMLLEKLKLSERAKFNPSVSCTNKSGNYLLYKDTISDRDLPFVLAHEIGHIYMNHLKRYSGYFDTPEYKDEEAFRFAAALMSPIDHNYKTTVLALAITSVALAASVVLQKKNK